MVVLRKLFIFLVRIDVVWFLLKPFSRLGSFLLWARNEMEEERIRVVEESMQEEVFGDLFRDRTVLHGPFKGMRYPSYNAIGSALYSKLLGSYESELHPFVESLCQKDFSEVINIGCGEGYYAVGLSRRIEKARVYAFDTDKYALLLCREMASLNNVADRINVAAELTPAALEHFQFTGRGLVVCDCEGFEKKLFTPRSVENLKRCYLLIETHDFIDITISTFLSEVFCSSHDITTVISLDDIQKAKLYKYDETRELDLKARKKLFREGRPAIMEWLYLTPKYAD